MVDDDDETKMVGWSVSMYALGKVFVQIFGDFFSMPDVARYFFFVCST